MYSRIAENAKKFDILGLEINFQMNGMRTYNTYPGLFFTILLVSFLIYSFTQMVNDIQNGVNPITQKTSQYLQQNEVHHIFFKKFINIKGFSFPAKTFVFVVYIGDSNGFFIQNTPQKTYYTIQFRKRVFGLTQSNITQLGFGQCTSQQLDLFEVYGASLPRQFVQCPPDDVFFKDDVIDIRNSIHLQNFTRYQFQVYRCVNSTTANYTCASNEEIDAKLQNAILSYSVPFYEFNSLNYSSPYEIKLGVKQMTINTQNTKVTNIVYKQSQTFTEQNTFYFFPNQRLDLGIEYYETYLDLQSGTPGGYLGGVQFSLDDQKFVYQRTYQNILNIFGALGGTFSVLRSMLLILLKPLQKLSFATIMFNKISNNKKIKVLDYFKSKNERSVIEEYYNIIQKAIELDSYMEIMLKYENDLLTFRSDKLVTQNAELFKSQRLQQITERNDFQIGNRLDDAGLPLDQNIQQFQFEQIISAREVIDKRISYNSDDYIVNDERSRK